MKIDRPRCEVKINGKTARPSRVDIEQHSFCLPSCKIVLSGENRVGGTVGQSVSVSLNRKKLFSGNILGMGRERGGQLLKCGHNLVPVATNFRKERAKYIFGDLAKQSGAKSTSAKIPDAEFPHFHCSGEGWTSLLAFARTLERFSDDAFDLFFDSKGTLNLMPTPKEGSPQINFKEGVNALLIGFKWLKAFPFPLGYGDFIGVGQDTHRVQGLRYAISPGNSLMEVFF